MITAIFLFSKLANAMYQEQSINHGKRVGVWAGNPFAVGAGKQSPMKPKGAGPKPLLSIPPKEFEVCGPLRITIGRATRKPSSIHDETDSNSDMNGLTGELCPLLI